MQSVSAALHSSRPPVPFSHHFSRNHNRIHRRKLAHGQAHTDSHKQVSMHACTANQKIADATTAAVASAAALVWL